MSENIRNRVGRYEMYRVTLRRYVNNAQIKSSITILLSVLLVVVFLVFAIKPTLVQIVKLKAELAVSQQTLGQLQTRAEALNQIEVQWKAIETKVPYLDTAIPLEPKYRVFSKELVVLAKESNVSLQSATSGEALIFTQGLSPYLVNKEMEPIQLSFSVMVGGDYEQLKLFWQNLIGTDRIAKIASVEITPTTKDTSGGQAPLTMSVTGSVFYLADSEQLRTLTGIGGGQ